ncbi:MAG: hypothetical protein EBX23_03165 [Proteobacteria bacterium]|nr:hypothetical protein [Pseudomonadota bacterium]
MPLVRGCKDDFDGISNSFLDLSKVTAASELSFRPLILSCFAFCLPDQVYSSTRQIDVSNSAKLKIKSHFEDNSDLDRDVCLSQNVY